MFALIAAVLFALATLVVLFGIDLNAKLTGALIPLGLTLLALHFVFDIASPLGKRRRR